MCSTANEARTRLCGRTGLARRGHVPQRPFARLARSTEGDPQLLVVMGIGLLLLALADSGRFDAFDVACALLGFGGSGLHLGAFHVSALFEPRRRGTVTSVLVGTFIFSGMHVARVGDALHQLGRQPNGRRARARRCGPFRRAPCLVPAAATSALPRWRHGHHPAAEPQAAVSLARASPARQRRRRRARLGPSISPSSLRDSPLLWHALRQLCLLARRVGREAAGDGRPGRLYHASSRSRCRSLP